MSIVVLETSMILIIEALGINLSISCVGQKNPYKSIWYLQFRYE